MRTHALPLPLSLECDVRCDVIRKDGKSTAHEWANTVGIVNGQTLEHMRDRKEDVLSSRRMEKGKQIRKAAALKECRDDFVWPKRTHLSKNGTDDVEAVSDSSSSCVQFPASLTVVCSCGSEFLCHCCERQRFIFSNLKALLLCHDAAAVAEGRHRALCGSLWAKLFGGYHNLVRGF